MLLYHADQKWIPGGFLGVDVFFVISGYLITCLLLSDYQQTNGIGLKRFWYRRARRLLPALFAMLFVVSLYAISSSPTCSRQLRGEVISALLYVENWFLIFRDLSYFQSAGRPPLLQHVWSLAVEEQYYLFWPLILMLVLTVWGKSRKALLIGVLARRRDLDDRDGDPVPPLHRPVTCLLRHRHARRRAAARLRARVRVGAVATHRSHRAQRGDRARRGRRVQPASSCSGCSSTSASSTPGLYRGGFLAGRRSCRRCSIAATVHPASKLVPWMLGFAVFRWIGVRSYGIYLWHWPIYMVTRPHSDVPLTGIPLLVLRLALTFGAAALSYKYIEEPIRHGAVERRWAQYRDRAGRDAAEADGPLHARRAPGITVGLVVIVVGLGNGGSAAAPAGFGGEAHVVLGPEASTHDRRWPAHHDHAAERHHHDPGTGSVATAVTAIGDSVMLGAANQLIATIDPMFATAAVPHVTTVDAAESRQFSAGVDDIQQRKDTGALGQIVIVQLGTNGTIDPGDFDRLMGLLADRQKVVLINAKVPRPWEQQVNDTLAAGAAKYKKNTVLLDWHGYGGAHSEFFYDDGIHLRPEGADAYARFVAQALGSGSP